MIGAGVLAIATVVGALTGCGAPAPEQSAAASQTASPPASGESPRRQFNACTDLDDDRVREMGLLPNTRTVQDTLPDESSACSFSSSSTTVRISTSSQSFESFRDSRQDQRIGVDVNGEHPAVWVKRNDATPCELALKTLDGTVKLTVAHSPVLLARNVDRCTHILDYAAIVEPLVGEWSLAG